MDLFNQVQMQSHNLKGIYSVRISSATPSTILPSASLPLPGHLWQPMEIAPAAWLENW